MPLGIQMAMVCSKSQVVVVVPSVVGIQNSLHIGQVMLSEAYYADVLAGKYPGLMALDAPEDMIFDEEGTLVTEWLP